MNASLLSAVLTAVGPVPGGRPLPALAGPAVVATLPVAEARACGWFESSWELQHGLAVSDLPDTEEVLAALWFPAWRGVAVAAAVVATRRLQ